MIILGAAETLAAVASVASKLTLRLGYHDVAGGTFNTGTGSGASGYLPNAAATQLTAGSGGALIRTIHIVNTDSSSRTFTLYVGGTSAQHTIFGPITLPAGYSAVHDDDGWGIYTDQGQRLGVGATGASGTNGTTPAGQIFLSAAGCWPSTTSGCTAAALVESTTNKQNQYVLAFPDGSTKYAECVFAMPSDWNGGTFTAVFYWRSTATSGVVKWQIEARSYGDAETVDQAFGTAQTVTDTQTGTASQTLISAATSAITASGTPAASELLHIRVARLGGDGSDTLTVDALLVGVMLNYTRA